MKIFFLLLFVNVGFNVTGQTPGDTSHSLSVISVVNIDSLGKDEIYQRTMLWCAESFKDNRQAINLSDKSSGLVVGKASFLIDLSEKKKRIDPASYLMDWKIEIKENKAKLSFTNIRYELSTNSEFLLTTSDKCPFDIFLMSTVKIAKYWANVKVKGIAYINALVDNYSTAMNKKVDNW